MQPNPQETSLVVAELVRELSAMDRTVARRVFLTGGEGLTPLELAERRIVPALRVMGVEWEEGRLALSQIYMASRICEGLLDELLPPHSPARMEQPKTAIAVLEDHHILGKRIVHSMVRAGGWEIVDLGRCEAAELADQVCAQGIRILLISVLMLRSAHRVREVRRLLDASGAAGAAVRIIVGGAPFLFDDQLWREVGADDTGRDASDAVAALGRSVEKLKEVGS